jgi:hypothetical protein
MFDFTEGDRDNTGRSLKDHIDEAMQQGYAEGYTTGLTGGSLLNPEEAKEAHPAGGSSLDPRTPETAQLVARLAASKAQAAQLKTDIEELEELLVKTIGVTEGQSYRTDTGVVTVKIVYGKRRELNLKELQVALSEELLDVVAPRKALVGKLDELEKANLVSNEVAMRATTWNTNSKATVTLS